MAKRKKDDMMGMFNMACCGAWVGVIHLVGGIGIGFLVASYVALPDMSLWGWILVGVSVVGHLVGLTRCKNCKM